MKGLIACVALVFLLGGCIQSELNLIPDDQVVRMDGIEGRWSPDSDPETVLCIQRIGEAYYLVTNSAQPGTETIFAFMPLMPDHYLMSWEQEMPDGSTMPLHVILRKIDDDHYFALLIDNRDMVWEAADSIGYPRDMLDYSDGSLKMMHPDLGAQHDLLRAIASLDRDFTGIVYSKIDDSACSQ